MYDDELTNLDDSLRRLKVEYDIFFNGHRKRAPDELRLRVEKLFNRLSEARDMSIAERFRYNTLVTRFYVLRDRWRRTQQQREIGAPERAGPALRPELPAQPEAPRAPVASELRISISDPASDEGKIRRMYEAMVALRGQRGEAAPGVSYPQFARYVAAQTEQIREKYGCRSVQFAISVDESAIRFTARAEGPPGPGTGSPESP